jgi:NitT/TauT family transport system permease protein
VDGLFDLRGSLSTHKSLLIEIIGAFAFIAICLIITETGWVPQTILPSPINVLTSLRDLYYEDDLINNIAFSIELNVLGYIEAVAIALPIGFLIGLFPLFRSLSARLISSLRYLPLPAGMGLFILWFGIGKNMKVQFLAFGILVYLLPVVLQRIDEVQDVYLQTIKTLGASKWQTIRHVFIPDCLSRISDDIRVLVAISWTYIIIAEVVNKQEGGIGALAATSARQSRVDKVFAILVIIVLIGFIQDKFFVTLDRYLFPFKHK